ncbi:MAG: hypothetical protein ACOX6K_02360 [Sphaerochaetaceae bacterium]|jgi:hypothetical protein
MIHDLLELLQNGRAWTVEELAVALNTYPDDLLRCVEELERTGHLRRIAGCDQSCLACSSVCDASDDSVTGKPVFWELVSG